MNCNSTRSNFWIISVYTRLVFHSCYFLKAGVAIVFTTKHPGLWLDNLACACSKWLFEVLPFHKGRTAKYVLSLMQALCVTHALHFGCYGARKWQLRKIQQEIQRMRLSFFLTYSECDYIHAFGTFEGRYYSLYILLFLLCLDSVAYRYIMRYFS